MNPRQPYSGTSSILMLDLLAKRDYTASEMCRALDDHKCYISIKNVQKKLRAMANDRLLKVTGERGAYHSPVYALRGDEDVDEFDVAETVEKDRAARVPAAPLGIIPTRPLSPMAWIVVTSGASLEA